MSGLAQTNCALQVFLLDPVPGAWRQHAADVALRVCQDGEFTATPALPRRVRTPVSSDNRSVSRSLLLRYCHKLKLYIGVCWPGSPLQRNEKKYADTYQFTLAPWDLRKHRYKFQIRREFKNNDDTYAIRFLVGPIATDASKCMADAGPEDVTDVTAVAPATYVIKKALAEKWGLWKISICSFTILVFLVFLLNIARHYKK